MRALSHRIDGESSMLEFGEALSDKIEPGEVIYLIGELGTGKTTLVRGILSGLGYQKNVVSPTYTLIEPYTVSNYNIYHLDLYRLNSESEIENLGLRDLLDGHAICFIEWPDKFTVHLPPPSLTIRVRVLGRGRAISLDPDPVSVQ